MRELSDLRPFDDIPVSFFSNFLVRHNQAAGCRRFHPSKLPPHKPAQPVWETSTLKQKSRPNNRGFYWIVTDCCLVFTPPFRILCRNSNLVLSARQGAGEVAEAPIGIHHPLLAVDHDNQSQNQKSPQKNTSIRDGNVGNLKAGFVFLRHSILLREGSAGSLVSEYHNIAGFNPTYDPPKSAPTLV